MRRVVITGQGDEQAAVAALKLGAYDYLVKRDNYLVQLPYAIDNAIDRFRLSSINRRLELELAERERTQAENARLLAEVGSQRRRLNEIIDNLPGIVWETWGGPGEPEEQMDFVSDYVERLRHTHRAQRNFAKLVDQMMARYYRRFTR